MKQGARRRRKPAGGLVAWLVGGRDGAMVADDLEELFARDVGRGLSRWRAGARYARNLIGSVYSVRRAGLRRFRLPGISILDVKLGVRTLRKHPGVTVVGCFALAIGIPIGLAPFQLVRAISGPLPFDEADRLVGIEYWDVRAFDSRTPTLHDYEAWRRDLAGFEDVAAVRTMLRNLVVDGTRAEVVRGSEVTASAFGVLRVRPHLGRVLLAEDERPGAEPVVVLGYDLWRTRFAADPGLLGSTVRFGRTEHTVVGVMPPGFQFPIRDNFWVPLQARALDYEWRSGPAAKVFGRLRDGVSRERAQAEVTAVTARMAADHPETDAGLRAEVRPLPHVLTGLRADHRTAAPMYLMTLLLLAVTCGNVGTLVLARVAGRSDEIAVRSALGASRGNIVLQQFVETLLLALLAAAIGLGLAQVGLRWLDPFMGSAPFWVDFGVRPYTLVIAGCLAVFSALVAGALPALKATRKNVRRDLQRQGTTGSALRFGGMTTVLVVAEVAVAVAGLTGVVSVAGSAFRNASIGADIEAGEYLSAEVRLPLEVPTRESAETFGAEFATRFGTLQEEIARRVAAEPAARALTWANVLPGMDHPVRRLEVEGQDPVSRPVEGHEVHTAQVAPDFFEALEQPVLAGRGFDNRDLDPDASAVLVNRAFVDRVLGGANAIGRRVRYMAPSDAQPGPWMEIVGVVNDLGMNPVNPERGAGVYHVLRPGTAHPVHVLVRTGGEPTAFVPRLRAILTEVEPALLLDDPLPLDEVFSNLLWEARFGSFAFALVAVIAVVLSAAGLYALMAFTVSQRTREIGVRTALGARPAEIARVIVRRALLQLAAGVAVGAVLGAVMVPDMLNDALLATNWPVKLVAIAALMTLIGLLACAAPTSRALRIQPGQALRDSG